ncbi:MAG: molybdopterin-dependent oxidoreductase [Deltaproteobacteria bacterium]|nr:molybdopterin-dependent oxidoreductase [Deltaproteobacteria bacterium]
MTDKLSVVGKSVTRFDAVDKVTGKAKYGIDLKVEGMLYGKILRSPYPHARVIKIDTRRAENHPRVRAVTTINDVPKITGAIGHLMTQEGRDHLYLHDNIVRFIGDPIAAVAADDLEAAQDALSLIHVEYEELPAVFDPVEAMKDGAPVIHTEDNNIAFHVLKEIGELDQGLEETDHVFEERYYTSKQKHATMEPTSSCVADYSQNGRLSVYSSTQRPHVSKLYLAKAFDLPVSKVRIIKPYTGGAFGGRDYLIHGLEIMCTSLSMKSGSPVKISFTREEDFIATEARHPFIIDLRFGVTDDGILKAMEMKCVMDVGGYGAHAAGVMTNALTKGVLIYKCPNITFEGHSVYTNKALCGAYRGYGNPQINFAIESLMDQIAEKLGIDAVELRLKNYRGLNELDPLSGQRIESDGMTECIEKAAEKFDWIGREKRKVANGTKRTGTGMCCLIHHSGGRFAIPDPAAATVMFNSDGSVNLVTAAADEGQGNRTVLAQIAAETLGLDYEQVSISSEPDTDMTPFDSGTHGSRQTYAGGIAVKRAAEKAKDKLLDLAAQHLEARKDDLRIGDGFIFHVDNPSINILVSDLLTALQFEDLSKGIQVMGTSTGVAPAVPTIYGANFAEVEVDMATGEVRILKFVCAFDVGKAINPAHVEGQIIGGEVTGMGYALTEGLITKDGKIMNPNFGDYRMLRACDVPKIDAIIVESPEPSGPFGAKGVGEATNAGTAAVIANAIYDAVGVRIEDLPLSQEKILHSL